MRNYELSVLVHPDLEMNPEPALNKVKDLVEKNGGEIVKMENEGKKRLAYKIKGQEFAVYFYYDLKLPADAPHKIDSVLNITDEVIRHLLVSEDERKVKYEARQAARQPHEEVSESEEK